jgi:hypothetical protein
MKGQKKLKGEPMKTAKPDVFPSVLVLKEDE